MLILYIRASSLLHADVLRTILQFHVTDVAADTKDKDEIMESEFFDTRQAFLSLCQGNHYQYDTLRRAKHSSMMVLYHLHNPTAPAFVATCNSCNRDIDTGQGWRCETCVDFDLCNTCKESATHEHKLVLHSERNAQNKEARQMRVLQVFCLLQNSHVKEKTPLCITYSLLSITATKNAGASRACLPVCPPVSV